MFKNCFFQRNTEVEVHAPPPPLAGREVQVAVEVHAPPPENEPQEAIPQPSR